MDERSAHCLMLHMQQGQMQQAWVFAHQMHSESGTTTK
jgi:hypothetical protein